MTEVIKSWEGPDGSSGCRAFCDGSFDTTTRGGVWVHFDHIPDFMGRLRTAGLTAADINPDSAVGQMLVDAGLIKERAE